MKYLQQLEQASILSGLLVAFRKLSALIYCIGIYICVYMLEYVYYFAYYNKLKTAEVKAGWSVRCSCAMENFVSYLWLSYWCDFFLLVDSYPQNTSFCHLLCLVLAQSIHSGQQCLPSWILQACCTSMFGTCSLEGICPFYPALCSSSPVVCSNIYFKF